MASWPQRQQRSRCPPSAAVRQCSIASSTRRCCHVNQDRFFSIKLLPRCSDDVGHLEGWRVHLLCSLRERLTWSSSDNVGLVEGSAGRLQMAFRHVQVDGGGLSGRHARAVLARSVESAPSSSRCVAKLWRLYRVRHRRHYTAFPTMPLLGCGCFVCGLSSFVRGIVRPHRLTLLMNDQQGFHFCKNDRTASTGAFEQVSRCLFGSPVRARL